MPDYNTFYSYNMKLFAFLLVSILGAVSAFVTPSAFRGNALQTARASTRGECRATLGMSLELTNPRF